MGLIGNLEPVAIDAFFFFFFFGLDGRVHNGLGFVRVKAWSLLWPGLQLVGSEKECGW